MILIDKEKYEAKVVALMKRHPQSTDNLNIGYRNALTDALNILGTLEVKEVDLEKEFSQWWKDESAKDYNVDILYERYSNVSMKLVKHFFELGLKAQKGE